MCYGNDLLTLGIKNSACVIRKYPKNKLIVTNSIEDNLKFSHTIEHTFLNKSVVFGLFKADHFVLSIFFPLALII